MGVKRINSTKVDEFGKVIKANIKEWKEKNPGKLVFDSRFEWGCWMRLKASGIKFNLKPDPLELIPTQFQRDLVHTIEIAKALSRNRRDSVCKADKTMYKRLANKNNQKELRKIKIYPTTWAPDFHLPTHNMYIESKGYANDAFPIKLKLAQHLYDSDQEFIVVYTLKDIDDLILFLKNTPKN